MFSKVSSHVLHMCVKVSCEALTQKMMFIHIYYMNNATTMQKKEYG
jgi:hypothetical protein